MSQVFLGFAPVSALSTSWCVLRTDKNRATSELCSGVSTGVDKALAAARDHISGPPDSIGIAAPLYWTIPLLDNKRRSGN